MPTKWCHQCGSEFVGRVDVCPDCGVDLRVEPPGDRSDLVVEGSGDEPDLILEPGDQLVYELHEWSEEARQHLERLLSTSVGAISGSPRERLPVQGASPWPEFTVPHVWQGTDLLVPAAAQERAEALIDEVEVTVLLALDPEAEKLAYDLSDLIDDQLDLIAASLAAEGIPHGFDDETGELVVHEVDEEKVEAILDAVDFPDALPVDDGDDDDDEDEDDDVDPLAAQEAMSALFVAADRLRKDARDPDGVLSLVAATEVVASLPLPYGFSEPDWTAIVERSRSVVALIDADDTDDEAIEEEADRLRTLLRQYV